MIYYFDSLGVMLLILFVIIHLFLHQLHLLLIFCRLFHLFALA
jgi:hypothetical protein